MGGRVLKNCPEKKGRGGVVIADTLKKVSWLLTNDYKPAGYIEMPDS
jgi:hypothetical protein